MPLRFPTSIWLSDSLDTTRANVVIQRIERDLWDTEDALDKWRDHAHDLEARNQELLDWGNAAVNRINDDLLPRITALEGQIKQLKEVERTLRASNARMVPEGRRLEQRERDLIAHIDGKLRPRIEALEAHEQELVAKVTDYAKRINDDLNPRVKAYAKRINDDFIPEVAKLQEGQKAMQVEAARAVEREKALTEENERLRADLAAARHDLADADRAGHALRDEVDSLERAAHDRQALPS